MYQKNRQWAPEVSSELIQEIKLLKDMKNSQKHRKWKCISQILTRKGWNRSHVECRSKWVNCLAPGINNKEWTDGQLQLLYDLYEKYDSRWSSIQKELPNRTQIKIKNHFYSVLRGITRFVLKYFQEAPGNQTKTANRINPKKFQLMYKGAGQFSFLGDLISKVIAVMNFRFNKHAFGKIIQNNLEKFERLCKQILELANRLEDLSLQPSSEPSEDNFSSAKNQNSHQPIHEIQEEQGGEPAYLIPEIVQHSPASTYFNNYNTHIENPCLFTPTGQITFISVLYEPPQYCQLFANIDYCMFNSSY